MAKYCNKYGNGIGESEWRELRLDYDYTNLAEYQSDKIWVHATWDGKVDDRVHEMFWEPFAVDVNYMVSGKWVADVADSKKFTNELEALDYYAEYLAVNSECHLDDDYADMDAFHHLVEVGNKAAERIAREKEEMREKKEAEAKRKAEVVKQAQAKREIEKEKMRKLAAEKKELEELMAAKAEQERIAKRGDSYGSW